MNHNVTCFLILLVFSSGCAHKMIPGTKVKASKENMAVYEVMQQARLALEERNLEKVISFISPQYFEDLGTPDPNDDFGYAELTQKILPESLKVAKEVHIAFQIYDIVVIGNRATADIRYTSRARLELPVGSQWTSHKDFDRIELVRTDGKWLIIKGL